jgi:hypothetical protein
MAPKDQSALQQAVAQFLQAKHDPKTVNDLEQRLELHLAGTNAYIPAYTRADMDKENGAPVVALYTKTITETNTVYIYAVKPPIPKDARKLRGSETMGPAYFAFGVPLRTLGLQLPVSRKVILPLTKLPIPEHPMVYVASLAEIEKGARDVDMAAISAAKQQKAVAKQARKARSKASPSQT